MRFHIVSTVRKGSISQLQAEFTSLIGAVTTAPISLVGNGNTFTNCHLLSVGHAREEQRHTTFELEFEQEIDA